MKAVPELGSMCTWSMVWRTVDLGPTGVQVLGENDARRPWGAMDQWLEDYLNPKGETHGEVPAAGRGI